MQHLSIGKEQAEGVVHKFNHKLLGTIHFSQIEECYMKDVHSYSYELKKILQNDSLKIHKHHFLWKILVFGNADQHLELAYLGVAKP